MSIPDQRWTVHFTWCPGASSCPLLLGGPGGGTVQDGNRQRINSPRPQAYVCVCVCGWGCVCVVCVCGVLLWGVCVYRCRVRLSEGVGGGVRGAGGGGVRRGGGGGARHG